MSQKPKIVFVDAGTVDFGDISFKEIQALGDFKAVFSTKPSEMTQRLQGADIAITNKCRFEKPLLESLKTLRCICVSATGFNIIDTGAAKGRGIAVMNVPGYSTETVVQFTIGFILALAGKLVDFNRVSHDGTWSRSPFFTLGAFPIMEVYGKTLGIIGYGAIGKRVGQVARSLGMKVTVAAIPGRKYAAFEKSKRVSLDKVLRESDFVTIHAPLTPLTQDLINRERIRKMKRSAFLINMARGGIVNEIALKAALKSKKIAGAATDVLSQEPPPVEHVLLGAPNLLLTPHVAWASLEARARLVREIALNIKAFLGGRKRNRVEMVS